MTLTFQSLSEFSRYLKPIIKPNNLSNQGDHTKSLLRVGVLGLLFCGLLGVNGLPVASIALAEPLAVQTPAVQTPAVQGASNVPSASSSTNSARSASTASASSQASPPHASSNSQKSTKHSHPFQIFHHSKPKIISLDRFGETDSVKSLALRIALEQDLPKEWVFDKIANAHLIPSAVQQMMPAPVPIKKNWHAYRARFIEPKRIGLGVEFWKKNAQTLTQAEREYGVPAEIIVGILGVETLYGQHMGAYPVLDSLATLSLQFPKEHPRAPERQAFFQNELAVFLKQQYADTSNTKREVLGSYAGAIGAAQFMPSSMAKFAVDYDHDGRIDLIHSHKDAIGSIANYFKMFGWQTGVPARFEVNLNTPHLDLEALLLPDILPTFSAQSFEAKGVTLIGEAKNYSGQLALIELQNGNDPNDYLAGTENFYVVTRYNWSSYYAMAVLDLGEAVKQAYLQKVVASKH